MQRWLTTGEHMPPRCQDTPILILGEMGYCQFTGRVASCILISAVGATGTKLVQEGGCNDCSGVRDSGTRSWLWG